MNNRPAPKDFAAKFPTKSLSDCLDSVKVPAKIPRSSFLTDGTLPIISQESDFINGYWDNEADAIRVDSPVVVFGDHTQVLKLVDFDFVVGADGVKILKPKDFLDASFLRCFLEANPIPSLGYARHYRHISGMDISLPPLEKQKRIVAVLDQGFAALDRARAHAEANLAEADELLEVSKDQIIEPSRLKGRLVRLADVTSIDSTLVDPRQPEFFDMRHIGAGNMVSGTDALVDVMTARQEGLKSGKYLFDETMVLYSKIRPYLRKVARPDFTGVCSADVYPLSPSAELDRDFLFHVLHTKDFTEYATSGSDRAGMPKVNREHLFKYEFWLPPLAAQLEAASKIDLVMEATGRLKASLRLKLSQITNLRQSLLQKAFSGQLT